MIEAFVTFSLIGFGLLVWAVARLARGYYRQQRLNGTGSGDSFWATLLSDGVQSGEPRHGDHETGHSHGADHGHHGDGGGHH